MFCTTMNYIMEALKAPLLYMTLCISTFLIYIKSFMVIGLFIYMCKNVFMINL